jgi:hypothetical protein
MSNEDQSPKFSADGTPIRRGSGKKLAAPPSAIGIESLVGLPRAEFLDEFIQREQNVFDGFRNVFRLVIGFSLIVAAGSIGLTAIALQNENANPLIIINAVVNALQYGIILYLASLCSDFVILRSARLKNETANNQRDIDRIEDMGKKIEKKVEERANSIKTGDNAIVIVNSTTGDVEQTVTTKQEMRDPLALLIAYAEESGHRDAINASKQIAEEAAKQKPDKSLIFSLWNDIVKVVPKVADVIEIANTVMKLIS